MVTGHLDPESSQVRRPVSSPERLTSPTLTGDSSEGDEGLVHSPWSRMMGRDIGHSVPEADAGSYLQSDEEVQETEEEEQRQDLSRRDSGQNHNQEDGQSESSQVRRPMSSPALTADSSEGDEEMLHSPWSRMMGRGVGESSSLVADESYQQNDEEELEDDEYGDSVIVEDDDFIVLKEEEEIVEEEKGQDVSRRDSGLNQQQVTGHLDSESSDVRRPLSSPERLISPTLTADSSEGDEGMLNSPWSRMMGRGIGDSSLVADVGSYCQSEEDERGEELGDFVIVDDAGNYLQNDEGFELKDEEEMGEEDQGQDLTRRHSEPNPQQGYLLPESNQVRRSVSIPTERLGSPALTVESSDGDEAMLYSPWSGMMGRGIGDSSLVAEAGSYLQSDDEERVEEETEEVEAELEEQEQDLSRQGSKVGQRLDKRQVSPLSISMSDVFSSESSQIDVEECRETYDWAWVVAHLVYSRYGEKMRRLRNGIDDKLIHFRSQTNFRSALMFKPELLPEDEVSMLPLLLKT